MSIKAIALAVVIVVTTGLFYGCTTAPHPLEIGVTNDGFVVDGQALKNERWAGRGDPRVWCDRMPRHAKRDDRLQAG